MTRKVAILSGAALVLGCSGTPDPVKCNAASECPVVDEDAAAEDVRVLWADGQKLEMTLDGAPTDVEVVGGEAVFTPDPSDPDCEGDCAITLKRLRLTMKTLYFVSSEDSVKVENLTISLRAPATLENPDGSGSVVPVGTATHTCATVQGLLWAYEGALSDAATLVARSSNEQLELTATIPFAIDGSTSLGCRPFELELNGSLVGATPFDQNPIAAGGG
ncbi:MAG TPA: hypothetical protein VF103_16545 [Polyangiaceae bacterium]